MSSNTSEHHHPHVMPLSIYLGVALALMVLTVVTVAVAYVDLGPFSLIIAMAIATTKAVLVALFFMHLLYDNKFYMYTFVLGVIFVGILISLTMFDTLRRGDIYDEVGQSINKQAAFYEDLAARGGDHGAAAHGEGDDSHAAASDSTAHASADSDSTVADTTAPSPSESAAEDTSANLDSGQ